MESENDSFHSGVFSKEELVRRIHLTADNPKKLFVTPLIDEEKQVDHSTITIRLASEFVLFRRAKYSNIDPLNLVQNDLKRPSPYEYQERVYVELGDRIILHAHQMILGSTLEYIGLPEDMIGQITSRSSWGRLGLITATASIVHPTFKGVLTLELVNDGDTPITLYPGSQIAQILLLYAEPQKQGKIIETRYLYDTSPQFSQIYKDKEWPIILKMRKEKGKFPRDY